MRVRARDNLAFLAARPPMWAIPVVSLGLLLALLWSLPPNIPYSSFTFAGSAVIFFGTARNRRALILAALAVPVVSGLYFWVHSHDSPGGLVSALSMGAGGAAIGATALLSLGTLSRPIALRRLAAVGAMPAFVIVSTTVLYQVVGWHPLTFDSTLSAVDHSFGFDPSFLAGQWLAHSRMLWRTSELVYDSLPFALCLAAAARWRTLGDDSANALASAVVASGVALFLFQILPACGPRFLWGPRFPFDPPTHDRAVLGLVPVAPREFRNALPSLHMAGALIAAWALRPLRFHWRVLAWSYVAFTVLGTLGSGQHYLVDLIVACPFALAVDLSVRQRRVSSSAAILFAIVGAWLIALRWFSAALAWTPGLTIGASAATIVVVALLVPQLEPISSRGTVLDGNGRLPSAAPMGSGPSTSVW